MCQIDGWDRDLDTLWVLICENPDPENTSSSQIKKHLFCLFFFFEDSLICKTVLFFQKRKRKRKGRGGKREKREEREKRREKRKRKRK